MAIASSAEQRSRALGACYGLLVGDALGAPYEFRTRGNYEISSDYVICETFGHVNFPLGGWTDDSSMALCLLESLLENDGKWNAQDCVKRWMRWMDEGYMSCVGVCFDVGIGTSRALQHYHSYLKNYGELPREPVCNREERDSGNGSLMRLCPAPLFSLASSPTEVARLAAATSLPTHASALCTDACALFALYIYHLVRSPLPTPAERKHAVLDPQFTLIGDDARAAVKRHPVIEAIRLGKGWRGLPSEEIRTSGFVVHTLQAALWALDSFATFEEGMMALLPLGDDVDTVCAVYGQIAGACYGLEDIPARWRDGLARKEMFEGLRDRMVAKLFA